MSKVPARKRILGWMMFDWASQPYNSLLLTFIFGPYFFEIVSGRNLASGMDDETARAAAQSTWSIALAVSGFLIAITAPVLGAFADGAGRRMPYIWLFSLLYVVGAGGLWLAHPETMNVTLVLFLFVLGLIGMELATAFTNAMMPEITSQDDLGRLSGSGWAVGYWGGLAALVIMLLFLAENSEGKTLLGRAPLFDFDTEAREGTRFVGPFTAVWYVVFMIPFVMWVRETRPAQVVARASIGQALHDLGATLRKLPQSPSLMAYLGSSMLYRDALAGVYAFGGLYARGVLGWSVVDVGIFGILAIITGAIFAWLGGKADRRFGPKPVIAWSILALTVSSIAIVSITPSQAFGLTFSEEPVFMKMRAADIAFYFCGAVIGAAGGTVQAASRTMLVRQGNPKRMTEAFGLYAMAGKATAFLAPSLVWLVTTLTESQRLGVSPIIALFLLGLVLLFWVKPEGEESSVWASDTSSQPRSLG